MANIITRRDALRLTVGVDGGARVRGRGRGADPARRRRRTQLAFEKDAKLRILRPARFVEPDETLFRANTAKFQQTTGIETRVDFVGWEDMRQQSAVAANTGTGLDIVIGWSEDPHVYADKIIELSDLAEYLGKRYGGWTFPPRSTARRTRPTTGRHSVRRRHRTDLLPKVGGQGSGFDAIPHDHATYLKLLQAMKKINKPAGFALGNVVGDGNGFANWLVWSHGAYLVDEAGKVAINSKETIEALEVPEGSLSDLRAGHAGWGDPSNNRAYAANECWLTANGVSLYYALKNDPATRAIADDTEHAPLPYAVGKPPQASLILNGMVFKHSKFANAAPTSCS